MDRVQQSWRDTFAITNPEMKIPSILVVQNKIENGESKNARYIVG